MLTQAIVGFSLLGAEWVLYLLLALSVFSISLIVERFVFFHQAAKGSERFRNTIRELVSQGKFSEARTVATTHYEQKASKAPDFETAVAKSLLDHAAAYAQENQKFETEVLNEVATDSLLRVKLQWEKNLASLATIGNNAPFIGLFGTVLGIIVAFHDLSQQSGGGATKITAGLSEALVATAIGIFVALPAVAAFNYYQRKVRASITQGEALKSHLVGNLAQGKG